MSKDSFLFPQVMKHEDYVESWYPVISDLTFKTWIFKFTLEEGILLHRIAVKTIEKKPLTENDELLFNNFQAKVKTFFEKVKNESPPKSGFFLRLGSRSLKDGVLNSEKSLKRMNDLLYNKYLEEYNSLNLQTKEEKIS